MGGWRSGSVLTVLVLASGVSGNICLIAVTGEEMLQSAAFVNLSSSQPASNSCQHSSEQSKVTNDLHAVKLNGHFSSLPLPPLRDLSAAPNSLITFSSPTPMTSGLCSLLVCFLPPLLLCFSRALSVGSAHLPPSDLQMLGAPELHL